VDAAGLLLANQRGELQVVATSNEQVRLLELFQLQNDEGPCLEAFGTGVAISKNTINTPSASQRRGASSGTSPTGG